MKRYNVIYYFLFVAILMGAFASMAQNSYGMKLMGFACIGFALAFLHELVIGLSSYEINKTGRRWLSIELIALSALSILFFFRSFLIEISYGKEGVLLSLGILLVVCLYNAAESVRFIRKDFTLLTIGTFSYYGSLALFIITFLTGVVRPEAAQMLGPSGFVLLAVFGISGLIFRSRVVHGEQTTMLRFVLRMKNKSGTLMIGFLLIFLYFGLNQANVLPPLYSGEMPPGYLELIRHAESGLENTEGKKNFEQFVEAYSKFVKRHRK